MGVRLLTALQVLPLLVFFSLSGGAAGCPIQRERETRCGSYANNHRRGAVWRAAGGLLYDDDQWLAYDSSMPARGGARHAFAGECANARIRSACGCPSNGGGGRTDVFELGVQYAARFCAWPVLCGSTPRTRGRLLLLLPRLRLLLS